MKKTRVVAAATVSLLGAALAVPMTVPPAGAVGSAPGAEAPEPRSGSDYLTRPWQSKFDAVRQAAIEQRIRTGGQGGVVERVGNGKYGKVEQSGKDKIFVVLAEFGNKEHSKFPDGDSDATRFNGPLHNQIPKPDRTVNNSTLWQKNYNHAHYDDMYFNRMKRFYENQSMGRYTIGGDVTQWVKVPFNQARYGRDYCGDVVCRSTEALIRDGLAYWVEQRLAAGKTMAQIRHYLKSFDHQDRYDFDQDGNFDEPDGFIDHFQVVHAGGDEADGDPIYGGDAIWSHKGYAQIKPYGTGPTGGAQLGGVNIGQGAVTDPGGADVTIPSNPTGVWVGDYTIQPENGGLSVFAHEFAHDLGLPDLYDTSGYENSTGFWSLMSQSRGTPRKDQGIGDQPMSMGAWEKLQLGWLDYDVARAGRASTHTIRPNSSKGKKNNGLVVLLPNKEVQLQLGDPCAGCGEKFFYSDSGDDLQTTMSHDVDAGGALTAKVRYDIEAGYDYAYLEASSDGGDTWDVVETNLSAGAGDGISGSSDDEWVDLTATVPAGSDAIRFRYATDGAVSLPGFMIDEITVGGELIGTAEAAEGWTLYGFRTTTGTEDQEFLNAYVVDNRQYTGNDKLLSHVYNFGFARRPDWVEFYRYQPGMLVSYWDSSQGDNATGDHPGSGEVLPVDAHPEFSHNPDGTLVRPRTLAYDSPFGLEPTDALKLHYGGVPFRIPSQDAVPVFNDSIDYWFDFDEHGTPHPGFYQPGWYSVDVPDSGTKIRVVKVGPEGVMTVKVGAAR